MPNKLSGNSKNKFQNNLLIFIVAYEAAETIVNVLNRIPDKLPFEKCEILIIDDASNDKTFYTSVNFVKSRYTKHPVSILKNPRNQGYGGNQKLGYRYAVDNNFDIVVLLHGDGQYAPESMPHILAPFSDKRVDAVFGSRMLSAFGALKGGMPLYKYFGNKILTFTQNFLLKTKLSEFHSGYRAYRVDSLKKVPFELNSNLFHFDTEIIIQFVLAKFKIIEIPIPTYYGEEICRVNGIKYAWDVLNSTITSQLQEKCICYHRKFDVLPSNSNDHYKAKLDFPSTHLAAISNIPKKSIVLDIGCGPGNLANHLKNSLDCRVFGIDQFAPANIDGFEKFMKINLDDTFFSVLPKNVNIVIVLDLIEHLSNPENFLRHLANHFEENSEIRFIFSTPNIAFLFCRLNLLFGRFNYGKRGILDLTHKRLFTLKTFRRILEENGFKVLTLKGIPPPFRLALPKAKILCHILEKFALLITGVYPSLFAFQSFVICTIRPTTQTLLKETKRYSNNLKNRASFKQ